MSRHDEFRMRFHYGEWYGGWSVVIRSRAEKRPSHHEDPHKSSMNRQCCN